jgi:hypothetical protein
MNWKPTEDVDGEIREWMKGKGWEVTKVDYDFDREIYAWRHEVRGGKSPTLRIERKVLEAYPAFAVVYHLDQLRVAAMMKALPEARLVVAQDGDAITVIEAG